MREAKGLFKQFLGLSCLCVSLLFTGCSTTGKASGETLTAIRAIDVPFFPQETFQCGPAALATVINYWYGKTGTANTLAPEAIAQAIYSPSAKGALGIDLELYARRQGFQARQLSGTVEELKDGVDEGVPSIVLVDYGFSRYQRNHFMVVKGYSGSAVLVNSGSRESELVPNEEFLKAWKRTGYWTLFIKP
jgi:predicted double-glycine peptidase